MNPVLIGAGIGALGSAIQGKSPLTGALLGGATGGMFGGSESLLGGKIADAFGQSAIGGIDLAQVGTNVGGTSLNTLTPVAGGGLGGGINIAPFVKEAGNGFASNTLPSAATTTGAFAEGIKLTPKELGDLASTDLSRLAVNTPLSMSEKVSKFGNDAYSWAKDNPMTAGGYALKGVEAINAPPEKINTSAQSPVRQGQFQGYTPTAAPSNVAPQIVPVPINKTGMVQLDTVIAQHPELRKLYPDLFGG
jgi:hypothetical protein